ncbi:MAG TPA: hypothetical protein VEK08_04490 [Planctomycetota bacterium]|nr:hypothetical protein [Planctomycetota bacterium]
MPVLDDPENQPPEDVVKQRHYEQFREEQDEQQRRAALRERSPGLYSRLTILENLVKLQEARGGEFPPKVVFLHMPDYILNVRRIGKVDVYALTAALEVYEHNDIVPGILWVPLDHIWWAGTTDIPVENAQVSLRSKPQKSHGLPEKYEELRHQLANLPRKKDS